MPAAPAPKPGLAASLSFFGDGEPVALGFGAGSLEAIPMGNRARVCGEATDQSGIRRAPEGG
jgi:hypothetical protein